MSNQALGDPGKSLEDAFFARENEALRQRLQEIGSTKQKKEAFSAASGITDDAVLERLTALNIGSDTVAALSLVPVVVVAWADGGVDPKERSAALSAAAEAGLDKQSASYQLLDQWLAKRPSPELLATWKDYMRAISATMGGEAKQALKSELLGRARRVAEASGGFLGIGRNVSAAEQAVLDDLEAAFRD
jgi:hypothetical protein